MVIIYPNSYEKLTKVKSGQIGVRSKIAQIIHLASMKSYLVIISPIHMKSWSKVKLGKVIMCPIFGFIYSYFAPIYHFGPDLAWFVYIFQYLALFKYIYQHLALFGYIYT